MCKNFVPSEFLGIAQQNRGLFFQFLQNLIQQYYYYYYYYYYYLSSLKHTIHYLVGDSAMYGSWS